MPPNPPHRLPNLSSLRAFEAAARHESFVRAGDELHVTHGAVSKQVQSLEQELGEALFERRNRGVYLTTRGRWLATRLTTHFSGLEAVFRDFRAPNREEPLTVSCEPTLCLKLLIPTIADLRRATGLEVRYLAAGGPVDFRRDHIDVAIRRNDFPIDGNLFCAEICEEWTGPVLSSAILASRPDAADHLHAATRLGAWRDWSARAEALPRPGKDITYEHFYMALQAAEAGQGVAIASVHMVARDLACGRLCAPCGFRPDGDALYRPFSIDVRKGRSRASLRRMDHWLVCREPACWRSCRLIYLTGLSACQREQAEPTHPVREP